MMAHRGHTLEKAERRLERTGSGYRSSQTVPGLPKSNPYRESVPAEVGFELRPGGCGRTGSPRVGEHSLRGNCRARDWQREQDVRAKNGWSVGRA